MDAPTIDELLAAAAPDGPACLRSKQAAGAALALALHCACPLGAVAIGGERALQSLLCLQLAAHRRRSPGRVPRPPRRSPHCRAPLLLSNRQA